jgi:hypothetical protein
MKTKIATIAALVILNALCYYGLAHTKSSSLAVMYCIGNAVSGWLICWVVGTKKSFKN